MTLRQFATLLDGEFPKKKQDMGSYADLLAFQKFGRPK